jgi:hypothetical protein
VVAVCRAVTGALHPHKVLAARPAEAGRPSRRPGVAADAPDPAVVDAASVPDDTAGGDQDPAPDPVADPA